MFASNEPLYALDRAQQPLALVRINRVLDVLLMCHQLQVFQSIVGAVKVFVVDLKSAWNRAIERLPHHAVNGFFRVPAVAAQVYNEVVGAVRPRVYKPKTGVASPSLTQLDAVRGRNTGAQELGNLSQQCALLKHALGLGHSVAVQRFAPRDPAHVAVIAHLVQLLEPKYRLPCFYLRTPFKVSRV